MIFDPFGDFASRGYLRNTWALKASDEVKFVEHRAFIVHLPAALRWLAQRPLLKYQDVLQTHKTLFQDVYPWAGQDRAQTGIHQLISKGPVQFGRAQFARTYVEDTLQAAQDPQYMRERPGAVMGNLAAAHPFLDGNGRTLLLVHNELAHRAGFSIDWVRSDKDAYLQALTDEIADPSKYALDAYFAPLIALARKRDSHAAAILAVRGFDEDTS